MIEIFKDRKNPFSFGGASIAGNGGGYGFGDINEGDSISLLHYAYERGVKVYDTAPIYGFGESEKRIGQAFKDKREKVFIISKSGVTWHPNKRVNMTNDPNCAKKMLEQSLRDLQSDYVDLYMVHWPDQKIDIRRTLECFQNMKESGKIRHIGLCNTNLEDLKLGSEVCQIEVIQSELNIFKRENFDLLNETQAFMSWGTLEKGIITGRVNKNRKFDKSDCRSWAPWWKSSPLDKQFKTMSEIFPLLEKYELSGLDLAIAFNLSDQRVKSVLCGVRNQKQLDEVLISLKKNVPQTLINECLSIVDRNMNA
ncbi:MAG: aldo/keto reductase [Halobacteriovoraceae bacterium]|nr:aldo/keto reductase [Halobacteriovoraceae bacterium]